MSRYITLWQLRDYISPNAALGTTQDGLLQSCIDRAEAAIDAYTRRNFVGSVGTILVNRYEQDRVTRQALWVDQDVHTLISLTNGDGQNIPVGSVWLEPREGPPYRALRLKSNYVWVWNTDSDVIVVGTLGYGTVAPADVQQATIRTAAYYFRGKDQSGFSDVAGFPEGGEQTIISGIPQDVRYLLSPYRSRTGGMI